MFTTLRSLVRVAAGVPLALTLVLPLQVNAELTASAAPIGELEIQHAAQPGDSLSRVALLYGIQLDTLLERNGIEPSDFLAIGDPVVVPLVSASAEAVAETAERGREAVPVPDPQSGNEVPPPLTVPRQARRLLEAAEAELSAARFAEARVLSGLGLATEPRRPTVRAGLERVAGTSEIALGRVEAAVDCFERALEADPSLAADPVATSPKVIRVLEMARARRNRTTTE